MNIIKTISGWFYKPTNKLACACGSTNVKTEMSYRRTWPPKNPTKVKGVGIGARISYGYKFKSHTCNKCGNVWEGEKL